MIDADRYSITVRKVEVDGESCFRAQVKELPDVASFADTSEEAHALAIDAITTLAAVAERKGKPFPEPMADDEMPSGRITLRLPISLHARAITYAGRDGISLNAYLISLISHSIGIAEGGRAVWAEVAHQQFSIQIGPTSKSVSVEVVDRGQWTGEGAVYALATSITAPAPNLLALTSFAPAGGKPQ